MNDTTDYGGSQHSSVEQQWHATHNGGIQCSLAIRCYKVRFVERLPSSDDCTLLVLSHSCNRYVGDIGFDKLEPVAKGLSLFL